MKSVYSDPCPEISARFSTNKKGPPSQAALCHSPLKTPDYLPDVVFGTTGFVALRKNRIAKQVSVTGLGPPMPAAPGDFHIPLASCFASRYFAPTWYQSWRPMISN